MTSTTEHMSKGQCAQLLAVAQSFDRRTVGEADVIAWHAAVGDLDAEDARDAIIAHYREETRFVMPADVRHRVKAVRAERLALAGDIQAQMIADGIGADDPRWQEELRRRVGVAMGRPVASRQALGVGRPR